MGMWEKITNFWEKYERRISTGAFVSGFILDSLTLTRIDLLYDNVVLLFYIIVAATGIVFWNATFRAMAESLVGRVRPVVPIIIQFAFGGLFSGFTIFYTRSATLSESWPFLIVLALLLFGNELLRTRYARFVFQISILFFTLFSYFIFSLPVLFHRIGVEMFLLAGAVSLFAIWAVVKIIPEETKAGKRTLAVSVLGIFLVINGFYFTNIIPPIPLSLKDAGVYHSVQKINGEYVLEGEKRVWYESLPGTREVYHRVLGQPVYFYSAVFSPTDLDTTIFHSWQYFDEASGKWIESDKISFAITGGRDGGYRGYSMKTNISTGTWRVDVVNKRGQIIGRRAFDVL